MFVVVDENIENHYVAVIKFQGITSLRKANSKVTGLNNTAWVMKAAVVAVEAPQAWFYTVLHSCTSHHKQRGK